MKLKLIIQLYLSLLSNTCDRDKVTYLSIKLNMI